MNRLALLATSVTIHAGSAFSATAAHSQVTKIDGYDGYQFGMTIEEAKRVRPAANAFTCSQGSTCIGYPTVVSSFPAQVIVRLSGQPKRVEQVALDFESYKDRPTFFPCKTVSVDLTSLLSAKFGKGPTLSKATDELIWIAPGGGSVALMRGCLGETGYNVVTYRPSNPI